MKKVTGPRPLRAAEIHPTIRGADVIIVTTPVALVT